MAETVTIEIDDIHELMFRTLMEDRPDAPSMEEWAEDTVQAILYQAYQNRDQPQQPSPSEASDIVEDATDG